MMCDVANGDVAAKHATLSDSWSKNIERNLLANTTAGRKWSSSEARMA